MKALSTKAKISGLALIIVSVVSCFLVAQAGILPEFLKQVPEELRGEYLLLIRMNPDKTHEEFTNATPFVTIFSNRVVLADERIRMTYILSAVRAQTLDWLFFFPDSNQATAPGRKRQRRRFGNRRKFTSSWELSW
jgi:hypothetical protein